MGAEVAREVEVKRDLRSTELGSAPPSGGEAGSAKIDRLTKSTTTTANGEAPRDIIALVAHSAHDDVGVLVGSGAAPSTTDLQPALDAEADEEHYCRQLEAELLWRPRAEDRLR